MELLLHQRGDWPELYRNTDKTEATEIVIIDSQMNYRGKLDTYLHKIFPTTPSPLCYNMKSDYGTAFLISFFIYVMLFSSLTIE